MKIAATKKLIIYVQRNIPETSVLPDMHALSSTYERHGEYKFVSSRGSTYQ